MIVRPASAACGEGDIITAVSGRHISSTGQVQALLQTNGGEPLALTVHRGQRTLSMTACPVQNSGGTWQLGAWIAGQYGGHRHADLVTRPQDSTARWATASPMWTPPSSCRCPPARSWRPRSSAVKKGVKGDPGELKGDFSVQRVTWAPSPSTATAASSARWRTPAPHRRHARAGGLTQPGQNGDAPPFSPPSTVTTRRNTRWTSSRLRRRRIHPQYAPAHHRPASAGRHRRHRAGA